MTGQVRTLLPSLAGLPQETPVVELRLCFCASGAAGSGKSFTVKAMSSVDGLEQYIGTKPGI